MKIKNENEVITIEQKAQRYDEALEKAKALYKASEPMSGCNVIIETLFPELKESEDEKIKNRLIKLIKMSNEVGGFALHKWEADEMLAWIDKQGEQKPADSYCQENCKGFQETGKCFADGECKAKKEAEQKSVWSEEDEKIMNGIIDSLTRISLNTRTDSTSPNYTFYKEIDWLKSLRPQNNITDEELAQAKKNAYNDALDKIEYHSGEPTFDDGWSAAIDYIRKKSLRPQNRWKPSEEQIKVCKEVYADILSAKGFNLGTVNSELNRLEEELKKLKK